MVVVIYTNFVSLDTDISFLFLWVGDGGREGLAWKVSDAL
jgi:hypothetical protein